MVTRPLISRVKGLVTELLSSSQAPPD